MSLAECRELLNSAEAHSSNGIIRFKLDTGRLATLQSGSSVWSIEPQANEDCTLSFVDIPSMRVQLANVALQLHEHVRIDITHGFGRALLFSYSSTIQAVFSIEECIASLANKQGLFREQIGRYLEDAVRRNFVTSMELLEEERDWKVRLLCLQVDMRMIQSHLDILGIDTEPNKAEEDDESNV